MLRSGLFVHRNLVNEKRDCGGLHLNEGMASFGQNLDQLFEPLAVRLPACCHNPGHFQEVDEQVGKPSRVRLLDVMMVQPEKLFRVKYGRGFTNVFERKFFDKFTLRKDLLISMRPSEAGEVINKRLG